MRKNSTRLHIPYASRFEVVLYVALGCLNIALLGILCYFLKSNIVVMSALVAAVYLSEIAVVIYKRRTGLDVIPEKNIHELLRERTSTVFKNSTSPVIAFDFHGVILWYNEAMRSYLDPMDNYIGDDISTVVGLNYSELQQGNCTAKIGGRIYDIEGFVLSERSGGVYMLVMRDITEMLETEKKYRDERVAVAYIAIDNVEDVLNYVHEKFSDEVSKVDDKLKAWADSMNAVIKSYDNEKYVMLFDSSELDKCI